MQENWLERRFVELSKISYERDIVTYTDFLTLDEQNMFSNLGKHEWYTGYSFFGGYRESERKMIAFISADSDQSEENFPISPISVTPRTPRFSEKLTHRDYLGSVLGLGIDRSKIGDILVNSDGAVIMAHSSLQTFLIENLMQVKNTAVTAEVSNINFDEYVQAFEEIHGSVTSVRLDSIITIAMKESRSKAIRFIEGGKVYINGKLISTNAYKLSEKDLISVRGYGKFQYLGVDSTSKKGKLRISIRKYV